MHLGGALRQFRKAWLRKRPSLSSFSARGFHSYHEIGRRHAPNQRAYWRHHDGTDHPSASAVVIAGAAVHKQPHRRPPCASRMAWKTPGMYGRRPKSISATKLGELAICQKMAFLTLRHGAPPPSPTRQAKLDLGTHIHERTERAVQSTPKPSPCFIATAVYGQSHPNTMMLRTWRDQVLRQSARGRWLIAVYYRISPPIARFLGRHPRSARAARSVLNLVLVFLGSRRPR